MKEYQIIYEDVYQIQDSIYIRCSCKPTKTEAKHILTYFLGIKGKIINILNVN